MRAIGVSCLLLLVAASSSFAADSPSKPTLSGFWELRGDSRSVPDAPLTTASRKGLAARRFYDAESLRYCRYAGMPVMMDAPLDIREGAKEIAIVSPLRSIARHLYIDGRKQVDLNDFETTIVGNSVAHWQGDTLVVHTIGFSDRGLALIPGGGYRTAKSELEERYHVSADGRRLNVSSTWKDAGVFAKPHTYEFVYYRRPANTNITEWPCDPDDEARNTFFEPALKSLKN